MKWKWFCLDEFRCRCCKELPADAWMYVEHLVMNVLDPVRDMFGKPIKVNSGYRCEDHNRRVGGDKNSQHLSGQAADVCAERSGYANMTAWKEANMRIARLIIKNGRFDQLILENVGENDLLPQWIHVSYHPRLCRGQVMKKVIGQKGYRELSPTEMKRLINFH